MASALRKQYRLGEYHLEPDTQLLLKDGQPVRLTNLPFQVFVYLVENRERLVSRAELLERFWEGREVYDDALRKAVGEIRKALDDPPRQSRFIETRRAGGYRYIGPLAEEAVIPIVPFAENGQPHRTESPKPEAARQPAVAAAPLPSRSQSLPAEKPPSSRRSVVVAFVLAGLILTFAAFFSYRRNLKLRASERGAATIHSLAVLPLKNLSGDPAQDYFSDGMTESLIHELAKLQGLKVISRSSVFIFKGQELDPREVGRQLNVESLLEGSVRKEGEAVRVSVRLVNTADGRVLWTGDGFTHALKNILVVQDELACSLAESLRMQLCRDQPPLGRPATKNVEAYEAYLRGRHYLNQRTEEGIKRSIGYFQRALELDDRYALAAVGLANAYNLSVWAPSPPEGALLKARAAAQRALELDDTLAEAHAMLGSNYRSTWEWAAEEREFQAALKLSANSARVHHSAAYFFVVRGRVEEALAQINRARELDPLNLAINADVAEILYLARRYDEAIAQCQRTLELDPHFKQAQDHLLMAELQKGNPQAVIASALKRGETVGGLLACAYAATGQIAEAHRILETLRERVAKGSYSPGRLASGYACVGDKEQAFAWFEKAYRQHDAGLVNLKIDPLLDPLRSDPRFADLLRRVGLPQ